MKEAEEQAALPYKWTQTIGDLDIIVEVPGNLKGRDLNVDIKKKKLVLGIKGQDTIISVGAPLHITYCSQPANRPVLISHVRVIFLMKYTLMNPPGRSRHRPLVPKSLNYT